MVDYLNTENAKISKENFQLKNQLTSERYKNERIHREMKEFSTDIKTLLEKELKETKQLKEDLVKEKAKFKVSLCFCKQFSIFKGNLLRLLSMIIRDRRWSVKK